MRILRLNDMRTPNIEIMQTVVRAETEEEIESFLANETVEPYFDEKESGGLSCNWHKVFKKDGLLEWFNPPDRFGGIINVGTEEEWIEDAIKAFNTDIMSIPTI